MKFEIEDLSATKKRLKVEIPAGDVEAALDKAYKELNASVKVDGFRPGHTPRGILEKRYAKTVEADALEKLVPEFYFKAVDESKIFPVDNPKFEGGVMKITRGGPLAFTATVEVRPAFELAGYRGIEVKDEPVEVTDQELEDAIMELREMHSILESVEEDRPAGKDDYVVIDFEGFMDGAPISGGKAENYPLQLGSGSFIPGFEEQLEGIRKGEERELKLSFPADYKSKDLAGKEALFKVTLKEIKKKALPEPDDEFAKDLGMGDTFSGLKEKVKKDIEGIKARALAARQKDHIMRELAKLNEFELPEGLVEKELRSIILRRHQEMLRSGQTPSQAGFDLKAFEAEAKPVAEERMKTTLILSAIAEKEDISVSDAELEAGIRRLAAEAGYSPQEVKDLYTKRDGSLESLRGVIGEDKVLDFLLGQAKKS